MSAISEFEKSRKEKAAKYLRLFLMDTPELNRLIRNYETDPERLEFALDLTISDWNTTAPVIGRTSYGNFPSLYLLIHGGAIQCLKMAGLWQSRNRLSYNAGGSSFMRADKAGDYQSWIQNFSAEYEAKKLNFKVQRNVEGGYSGFHSEYNLIGYDW